jgi:cytochrome oxidase Cu insertion factor (SCO1/SenC/PrrC family)
VIRTIVAITALLAVLVGCAPPSSRVPLLQIEQTLPTDQSFVNQGGRTFRWSQLRGRSVVLAFMHTRCRDASQCAATSAKFAAVQRDLPRGSRLLEVSLDPAYDRPAVLRRYGEMFGQDPRYWTLATGDPKSVLEFVRRFITVSPGREPADREHSEALAIFNRQQHLVSLTGGTDWQPDEALAEVRQTLGEASNPFDRLKLWSRNIGAAFGRVGALCGGAVAGLDAWSVAPVPRNLVVSAKSPRVLPRPPVAQPNAPPRIIRIWFSTLTLQPGTWFDGTIVASTNVASVEVRTASFSINSTHVGPGIYRFHTQILELPPLSRRHSYELFIIARNTPGAQAVERTSIAVQ